MIPIFQLRSGLEKKAEEFKTNLRKRSYPELYDFATYHPKMNYSKIPWDIIYTFKQGIKSFFISPKKQAEDAFNVYRAGIAREIIKEKYPNSKQPPEDDYL